MTHQQNVQNYFNCWITQDFSQLTDYFHEEIIYRECYGPIYMGLSEIKRWIADMLKKNCAGMENLSNLGSSTRYFCC